MASSGTADGAWLRQRFGAMAAEIDGGSPLYHPSVMWTHLNALNLEQLERQGLENFKRTVNQNYFNWLPKALADNQVRRVLRAWLARPTLRPLTATMAPPSELEGFAHVRTLDTWRTRTIYRLFVTLLWEHARRRDRLGVLDRLSEPVAGNPIRIRYRGRLISQDLANSCREANRIADYLGPAESPVVAELGAGYGRLAHVMLEGLPCRYWILDIPPALLIAEWYLSRVLPGRRIFRFRPFADFASVREELARCDVAFFTANQIALLPDASVDAFVNISSLHEMRPAQIDHYLGQMARLSRRLIYLKQWHEFTNTADDLVVTRKSFNLPAEWSIRRDGPDEIQDLFFELLAVRG